MNGKESFIGTNAIIGWFVGGFLIISLIGLCMWGFPKYSVYKRSLYGEAQLREAEWNRKIKVREAEAKLEAAKFEAKAEIERAKGVAEANKIIGTSLKDNEAYLRYLYINALIDKDNNIIYVPTEAGLPILEDSKR